MESEEKKVLPFAYFMLHYIHILCFTFLKLFYKCNNYNNTNHNGYLFEDTLYC